MGVSSKLGVTFWGVPIIGTRVFRGLSWGPPILGNCHIYIYLLLCFARSRGLWGLAFKRWSLSRLRALVPGPWVLADTVFAFIGIMGVIWGLHRGLYRDYRDSIGL